MFTVLTCKAGPLAAAAESPKVPPGWWRTSRTGGSIAKLIGVGNSQLTRAPVWVLMWGLHGRPPLEEHLTHPRHNRSDLCVPPIASSRPEPPTRGPRGETAACPLSEHPSTFHTRELMPEDTPAGLVPPAGPQEPQPLASGTDALAATPKRRRRGSKDGGMTRSDTAFLQGEAWGRCGCWVPRLPALPLAGYRLQTCLPVSRASRPPCVPTQSATAAASRAPAPRPLPWAWPRGAPTMRRRQRGRPGCTAGMRRRRCCGTTHSSAGARVWGGGCSTHQRTACECQLVTRRLCCFLWHSPSPC